MILVVGLSPAWQRTLEFQKFIPGTVNRATRVTEIASGKGVNVARVARQLGARVRLLTVAGGVNGVRLVRSLGPASVVRVRAATRMCQTILAGGTATELVEEPGRLSRDEVAKVMRRFDRELSRARLLVLSGCVPAGCGDGFYARLIRRAKRAGVPVLVDVQGAQLLRAAQAGPMLVKINRTELEAVPGLPRVEWLIVTDGARWVTCRGAQTFRVRPPRVKAVNPVGSGDAMLAGMAVALSRGESMRDAVRLGVGCGAANALSAVPGDLG